MFGNRGIYHKGWTAVTKHRTPWETGVDKIVPAFDDDVWELYDPRRLDPGARPGEGAPREACRAPAAVADRGGKYNVLPLDDRFVERGHCPRSRAGRSSSRASAQLLFGGMGRLTENSVLDDEEQVVLAHRPDLTVPEDGRRRRDRRAGRRRSAASASTPRTASRSTVTTSSGSSATTSRAPRPIPPGEHQVRMEFAYDGGGLGKGGTVDALRRRRRGR